MGYSQVLCALLCLVFLQPCHAEVYRWVDEHGNVHFSDKKPDARNADTIEIEAPQPAAVPDEGELRRLALVKQSQERFKKTVKLSPPAEEPQFDHATACRDARRNYGALTEVMPVYRAEDGNYRPQWYGDYYEGERDYVADEQRDAVMQEVQSEIDAHCERPNDFDAIVTVYEDWIDSEMCEVARLKLEHAQREKARTPAGEVERLRKEVAGTCDT